MDDGGNIHNMLWVLLHRRFYSILGKVSNPSIPQIYSTVIVLLKLPLRYCKVNTVFTVFYEKKDCILLIHKENGSFYVGEFLLF